jgi:hypothetical protein
VNLRGFRVPQTGAGQAVDGLPWDRFSPGAAGDRGGLVVGRIPWEAESLPACSARISARYADPSGGGVAKIAADIHRAHGHMLQRSIIMQPAETHVALHQSRTFPPDRRWRISMKNTFLAAFAALNLAATALAPVAANAAVFHNGSTVAGDAAATQMQKTGAY